MLTEKSLTRTDCGADEAWKPVPMTDRVALLVIDVAVDGAVIGIRMCVEVVFVAVVPTVPEIVQTTVPLPLELWHVAPETVPSVTLGLKFTVKTTPVTGSPRL